MIPSPLPDEHALGWLGRIKFFNHCPSMKRTQAELYSLFPLVGMENKYKANRPILLILTEASRMGVEKFIHDHSMLPFTQAFVPEMFEFDDFTPRKLQVYRMRGLRAGKQGSWFCPSCVNQDIQKLGYSYWRRSHQIFAVNWCPEHGNKLWGVLGKDTYFRFPDSYSDQSNHIQPDGAEDLQEEHPIIQEYVKVCLALMGREKAYDHLKVNALLRKAVNEPKVFGTDAPPLMIGETGVLNYWASEFYNKLSEISGDMLVDVRRLFKDSNPPRASYLYALYLTLLVSNDDGTILGKLDQAELLNSKKYSPIRNPGKSINWESNKVTSVYVQCFGNHKLIAEELGVPEATVACYLNKKGLLALGKVSKKDICALADFYSGTTLVEACLKNKVRESEVESLIRRASPRFAYALLRMDLM